jgi:hypothetical protein
MQKSKLLLAACLAAACLRLPTAQAEDTPAQAAARLALAQKLFQLSAGTNQPATATNVHVAKVAKPEAAKPAKVEAAKVATKPEVAKSTKVEVAKPVQAEAAKPAKEPKSNWSAVKPVDTVEVANPATAKKPAAVVANAPTVAVKPVAPAKPVAVYVKPTKPAEVAVPSATVTGDNPAQAAARAALFKFATTPTANSAAPATQPASAPATVTVTAKPIQVAPATVVAKPAQPVVVKPATVVAVKPVTAPIVAKPVVAPMVAQPVAAPAATVSSIGDNAAQAAAREALAKYMFESATPSTAEAKPAVIDSIPVTQPATVTTKVTVKPTLAAPTVQLQAVAAPATPVPQTREEKLQALLIKYKTDQITPEEYHRQRAELMAKH